MAFTFFFRDRQTLELIINTTIPSLVGRSKVNVWDAGCAMGPEPYSLAIMFSEKMGHFAFKNLKIYATDIDENGDFGKIISEGIYPIEQLRRIPKNIFNKYFDNTNNGTHYKIVSKVRDKIEFQKHDLLTLKPIRIGFSLIICKNVLLHFTEQQRIDVIKMFHSSLDKDGFLATEHTQKMPDKVNHLFKKITPHAQIFRKLEV